MKSLCISLICIASLFILGNSHADVHGPVINPKELEGHRIQPCRFWARESGSFRYICNSLDRRVDLTTVDEVQEVIDQLVDKINELEERIAKLEVKSKNL